MATRVAVALCAVVAVLCFFAVSVSAEGDLGFPIAPLPAFKCTPFDYRRTEDPPSNVNEVRPHDVEVVMSLGDSITAAFAATAGHVLDFDTPLIPREDRYLSYMAGAGSMQYTVHNFLKLYQYNITGGSYGQTSPIDALDAPDGEHLEPKYKQFVGLNAALSGAKVQDLAQEVDYIVEELNGHYAENGLDVENSWKVATILIGANNLCVACHNNTADLPSTFASVLNDTLVQMHEQIPRVRVNILPIFNVTQVYYWSRSDTYCKRVWALFGECPCLDSDEDEEDRMVVNEYAVQYRQVTEEVVSYWQGLNLDTFSVTLQPLTADFHIVNSGMTSNFDCFHPSQLSHAYLGAMLWNSMLLPPDQKPTNMTNALLNGIEFVCPEKDTYLQ
mmetsp:Transcript_17344/g.67435  ORF Transcript_17344/g.67435 Transcript_17344/m.67435 type:complete len:388 (-) Transcript_17344:42-1205(-)